MRTVGLAVLAWIGGAVLGDIVSGATIRRLRRRVRQLRAGERPAKMGVMDRVLVFEAVVLIVYTAAVLVVFWHTGTEPATLTACVFAVCGLENGVMGWIRTSKEKAPGGTGAEPPRERPEPPDAGM